MEWISVNTNGRYAVNRAGEVKNLETNKKLKPSFNKAGYLVVSLYDGQTHKPLAWHYFIMPINKILFCQRIK